MVTCPYVSTRVDSSGTQIQQLATEACREDIPWPEQQAVRHQYGLLHLFSLAHA